MTATADAEDIAPKKSSRLPLILGLVLALLGGGGGFMAVKMGFLGGNSAPADAGHAPEAAPVEPLAPASFVPLDPLLISMPGGNANRFLRFTAQLEVPPQYVEEVTAIKPRIVDVLNSYLRAVETKDIEDPTALVRLRAQMLRRIQVVTGAGRVQDLLIMEFVLN